MGCTHLWTQYAFEDTTSSHNLSSYCQTHVLHYHYRCPLLMTTRSVSSYARLLAFDVGCRSPKQGTAFLPRSRYEDRQRSARYVGNYRVSDKLDMDLRSTAIRQFEALNCAVCSSHCFILKGPGVRHDNPLDKSSTMRSLDSEVPPWSAGTFIRRSPMCVADERPS